MALAQSSSSEIPNAFDPNIGGIGRLEVVDMRVSGGQSEDDPLREHSLMTVDIDDYRHVVWVTQPLQPKAGSLNIVTKPGWFEVVEDGIGWQFHRSLTKRMPEARIVSHATHGVGPYADTVRWSQLPAHGLDQMAEQGLKLLQAYIPDERIAMVGTSMGTVINNRLLQRNLVSDNPINVVGVVNFASALVDPSRVLEDMGLRFPFEITKDGISEVFARTHPRHLLGLMAMLGSSRMRWRDVPTMGRQGIDLLCGTSVEEIELVTAAYPTATIVGEKDPVGQVSMWQAMEEKYPGFILRIIKGRGHGIAMKPIDGSRKITKTIGEMGLYPHLRVV